MSRKETVRKAIAFESPGRVPIWFFNKDQLRGDVVACPVDITRNGVNEWGYAWQTLNDGTMGQPTEAVLPEWDDLAQLRTPPLDPEQRMRGAGAFMAEAGDRYTLATLGISGFTVYTFLRGFENSLTDFILERDRAEGLLDRIFDFEIGIFELAAEHGFDGVHLADDWGSQDGLFISPALWRDLFKPRYARQVKRAHELGLQVWFHCCGNIEALIEDLHEVGMDVVNISQPNVVNLERVGPQWRGKQCFMLPISYQTTSISGTPESIRREANRMHDLFGSPNGGFIGYVEDYTCMGMSNENYEACAKAFEEIKL
jgi:uroporphyrinogen decarboxylase